MSSLAALRLMPAAPGPRTPAEAIPLAASIVLHAAFAAAVLVAALRPLPPVPAERPVAVEMLTPQAFRALVGSPVAPPPAAPAPPPDLLAKPAERGGAGSGFGATVGAARMLGAAALADPQNRKARAALGGLAPAERIAQLCALEAIEQVRVWKPDFRAEFVVDHATADPVLTGGALIAEGAAIQGNGAWHRLRFRCVLDAEGRVGGFEFALGAAIPERDWEADGLPAPGGDEEG